MVLRRDREEDQIREGQGKRQADVGVMPPYTSERLRKARTEFSPRASRGNTILLTPSCQPHETRFRLLNCIIINSCCLKPICLWQLVIVATGNNTVTPTPFCRGRDRVSVKLRDFAPSCSLVSIQVCVQL